MQGWDACMGAWRRLRAVEAEVAAATGGQIV